MTGTVLGSLDAIINGRETNTPILKEMKFWGVESWDWEGDSIMAAGSGGTYGECLPEKVAFNSRPKGNRANYVDV